jgi:hypothetical protein
MPKTGDASKATKGKTNATTTQRAKMVTKIIFAIIYTQIIAAE